MQNTNKVQKIFKKKNKKNKAFFVCCLSLFSPKIIQHPQRRMCYERPADFKEKSNDQPSTCLRQQFLPQAVRVVNSSIRNHKPSHTGINTKLVHSNSTVPTQLVHGPTSSQRIVQDLLAHKSI